MFPSKRALLLVTLSLSLLSGKSLSAQTPDPQVTERTEFIQKNLDEGQRAARLWWWGWLGGYTALTAGQMAVYYSVPAGSEDNDTLRDIMLVGSASSAVGVLWQLLSPMTAATAGDELRVLPANTPEERRLKLAKAEMLLRSAADQEKFGRSWVAHAAGFGVNLAAGLIIWQAMHHTFMEGFINFAAGMVISEAQIYTQPVRAVEDWQAYEAKHGRAAARALQSEQNWFLQFGGTSIRAGIWF